MLDRAANSTPQVDDLNVQAEGFRLRYLDNASGQWLDAWPPPQSKLDAPPRAVRWRLRTKQYGEIDGTVEFVSAWPDKAAGLTPPKPPSPIHALAAVAAASGGGE